MVIRCNEKWVIKRSNFHWGPFQPSWRLICCISSYTSAGAMHQRIPVHVQSQSGQIAKQRRRPFNQGDSWLKPIEIPSHAKKCIEMPSFGSICNWACFEVLGQSKWRISLGHPGSHCYMASDASELWPNFSRVSPKYFSTWWQGGETWQKNMTFLLQASVAGCVFFIFSYLSWWAWCLG